MKKRWTCFILIMAILAFAFPAAASEDPSAEQEICLTEVAEETAAAAETAETEEPTAAEAPEREEAAETDNALATEERAAAQEVPEAEETAAAEENAENVTEAEDINTEESLLLVPDPDTAASGSVVYTTHVQDIGWQDWRADGTMAGTSGESRRLEGICISLADLSVTGGVRYRTHVQNIGWQDWRADGTMAGTSGKSLRLEAIQIELTGAAADTFDIWYQTHIQNFGWSGWAKNGEPCGSAGYSYRLEAVRVCLQPRGAAAPGTTNGIFYDNSSGVTDGAASYAGKQIRYCTHVQDIGWQDWRADGALSGTTGESKRLEGIRISLADLPVKGGVRYRTHVQNIGWQDWRADGTMAGTSGKSLRLEAIQIELTGAAANVCDIYYRVHTETFGWLPWARNGQQTGTSGMSKRLESIEIFLLPKGRAFPEYNETAPTLKVNTVQKHLFLGDSRTCCIVNALHGTHLAGNGASADQWFGNDYFACKWGGHLVDGDYYFVNRAINIMPDNANVYLLMGRNDIGSPQSQFAGLYNNALRRLAAAAAKKTNTRVFFVTCGPDQGSPVTQFAEFNNAVSCAGVQKLNPWSSLGTLTYQTNIPGDFHYSDATSIALYNWLKSAAAR